MPESYQEVAAKKRPIRCQKYAKVVKQMLKRFLKSCQKRAKTWSNRWQKVVKMMSQTSEMSKKSSKLWPKRWH